MRVESMNTIILNLIFRKVMEVKIHVVKFWRMCVQFHHYHTQKYQQKLMFLTNFVKKWQKTYIGYQIEAYATIL